MNINGIVRQLATLGSNSVKNGIVGQNKFNFAQIPMRTLVTRPLAKNINFITKDDKINIKVDNNMKLANPTNKPLVIMLCWLGSTQKNILKYGSIYMDQGYDLLTVHIPMTDAFWPDPAVTNTAGNLLKFMEQNIHTFQPAILSSFSIGNFMWAEVTGHVEKDVARYQPIIDQLKVQIWDSFVDGMNLQTGISKAVFPDNRIMQTFVHWYIGFHFRRNPKAHNAYLRASKRSVVNYCTAPALHLCSKTDIVGNLETNIFYSSEWRKRGLKIKTKCWDESPHVQHYYYHPVEYLTELYNFLNEHKLLFKPELLEKKIEEAKEKARLKEQRKLNEKSKIITTSA